MLDYGSFFSLKNYQITDPKFNISRTKQLPI